MRRGAFAAGLVAFLLVGFGTVLFQEGAGQDKKSASAMTGTTRRWPGFAR